MSRSSSSKPVYNHKSDTKNNIPPPSQIPQKTSQESGGFMTNIFQGFSFGLGLSIAHRTVGSLFGYGSNNNSNQNNLNNDSDQYNQTLTQYDIKITDYTNPNYQSNPSCELLHKEFLNCIKETNSNYHCSLSYNFFKDCEDKIKLIELDK